jgi:hypothetical protein
VFGLNSRTELGAIFGYQWCDGSSSTPATGDANAVTDLAIAPKVRFWEGLDNKLKVAARVDLKLPTAPESRGLGTGDPDLQLVGIATYELGKTHFDSNIGYQVIDISRADFADDRWFVGEAVRQEVNKAWTMLAEVYTVLPNTRAGRDATWYFSGGPQWTIRENAVLSALIGSAVGHKSPDLTGTFEIALTF